VLGKLTARVMRWSARDESAVIRAQCFEAENAGVVTIFHACSDWRRVRNSYYRDNPACAACGYHKDIQVHHVVPWHAAPELRYTYSNLVSLCQPCHFRFGHFCDWRKWNPRILNLCTVTTTTIYQGKLDFLAEKHENKAQNGLILPENTL